MNVNLLIFSFWRRKSYQENWDLNLSLTAEVQPLKKKKEFTWNCLKVVIRQDEKKALILPLFSIRCASFRKFFKLYFSSFCSIKFRFWADYIEDPVLKFYL